MDDLKISGNKQIKFFIQDTEHVVNSDNITPQTTLNSYIRNILHLKGTKFTCLEGGCGACVIVIKRKNPITGRDGFMAINSCLVSVLSCHGWQIYTIEGIGGPLNGYHPIQNTLAQFNGTQCGYCSSGMIMNMYALYKSPSPSKLTSETIENSFGGNLCRCTGYRSILAAFKSLKCQNDENYAADIEDCLLNDCNNCEKVCEFNDNQSIIYDNQFNGDDSKWIKIRSFEDLLRGIQIYGNLRYRLIFGNTARGVYEDFQLSNYQIFLDINDVYDLQGYQLKEEQLILGANMTLTNTMDVFYEISKENSKFSYLKQLADHIDLIANVPVRNIGSLAGNLMMKHVHNEFPSDIFLILTTIGASFVIVGTDGKETKIEPETFLKYEMKKKILKSIILPGLDGNHSVYQSYKIMPRAQNAHAIINAGFLFNFENDSNIIKTARIIYGNVNSTTIHATQTEIYLKGKHLFDNTNLQQAYSLLDKEINPADQSPDPSPLMRKHLTIALFYKAILRVAPKTVLSPKNITGGDLLTRPVSSGTQDYETNKSLYPLTQPITKVEALAQTSGQAEYVVDLPDLPNQLYAAFVLTNAPPNYKIKSVDANKALKMKTIVAYYDRNDIPGKNNFMPVSLSFQETEEIFCSGLIKYYNQPIGIIVGTDPELIEAASELVEIVYETTNERPLLNVRDVLKANKKERIFEEQTITPKRKGNDIKHVVKGTFDIFQQYHFHMENQCCSVVPTEDGLNVFPSSQWMDLVQTAIAECLNIANNRINVTIRRCGGAFGAKISRNTLISCATALAAWKLRKPVKLQMSLKTNMLVIGKRWPLTGDYEVAVNANGIIQYLDAKLYTDLGAYRNEKGVPEEIDLFMRNYNNDTYSVEFNTVKTDTHTNTWARGPGTTEGLAMIESIMEHIAYETNIDPIKLRIANMTKEFELLKYLMELIEWANIDERKQQIMNYNQVISI